MDTEPQKYRALSICNHIRTGLYDVIHLQEVTELSFPLIGRAAKTTVPPIIPPSAQSDPELTFDSPNAIVRQYRVFTGNDWPGMLPYFPVTLVRDGLLDDLSVDCQRFEGSKMHRGYICVKGFLKTSKIPVAFYNSHLESLKNSSETRKMQLMHIFEMMRKDEEEGRVAMFAGDTNLRETEVSAREVYKTLTAEKARGGESERPKKRKRMTTVTKKKLVDAWLAAGAPEAEKFTWDTSVNDNLVMDFDFRPKARYDRAYLLWPEKHDVQVNGFKLIGKDRLEIADNKFPSDHWGVLMDFELSRISKEDMKQPEKDKE